MALGAGLALGICVVAVGCTSRHEAAPVHNRPPSPSSAIAPVAPTQMAVANTSDAGSSTLASNGQPVARYRTDVPGDTRGTIACGETRCLAGKQACGGTGCIPFSATRDYPTNDGEPVYECDDGSDCPAGSGCCALHMGGGYCQPRFGKAPPLYCNAALCIPDAGAACPAGESCATPCDDEHCDSNCETRPMRATFAPGKQCDGGALVWTYASATGRCVGHRELDSLYQHQDDDDRIGIFQCTRPSDCGSAMRCVTGGPKGSSCQPAGELANNTYLCTSDADCRMGIQEPFTRAKCQLASRNEYYKDFHFPPWVSVCRFFGPAD